MAVAAVAMSIQGDMKGWQKAIWMIILGAFLLVEFRALKSDRDHSDAKASQAKKDEEAAFAKVLKAQDEAFKVTVQDLEA
jgi:hypothetical protein